MLTEAEAAGGEDGYTYRLNRQRELDGVDSTEALPSAWNRDSGELTELGAVDPENAMHPNNRGHVFRSVQPPPPPLRPGPAARWR